MAGKALIKPDIIAEVHLAPLFQASGWWHRRTPGTFGSDAKSCLRPKHT
jgi:hypothetical protein